MWRAALISIALVLPGFAAADELTLAPTVQPLPAQNQEFCIAKMAEFPTDDAVARYQFFKLVQDTAFGATDRTQALFDHYGQPAVTPDTPVLAVIEDIANPVLRQAAPDVIVASMNYMVNFALDCEVFINGQTDSLLAFDATLSNPDFNSAIAEDALFLRQILDESLAKLGANTDPVWADAAAIYSASLVKQRDVVEFTAFEMDIAELESLFMEDLDGRLKRSNDTINAEIDRERLRDSVTLSNDLNAASRERARQERLFRLVRIFGGGI